MDGNAPFGYHIHQESAANAAPLDAALLQLLIEADAAVDRDREAAKACLARAAALLRAGKSQTKTASRIPAGIHHGGLPRWQAKRLIDHIDKNLGQSISSADLIRLTSLSASHFFRTFKATFGEAPFAYIARRRIERAQELMRTTNEPLSEIALACGLCDQSHFTRLFRRLVGMSPRAWRREYGCE